MQVVASALARVPGSWGVLACALMLAGCSTFGAAAPEPAAVVAPGTGPELIGSGGVRVAMLLPRSGTGNAAATASAFRNGAELAMRDFPQPASR
jgi:hypothetical protein